MLDKTQKDNPYGVEKHFCKVLDKFAPAPLEKGQVKTLIMLSGAKDLEKLEQLFREEYWFYDTIDARLIMFFTYTMDTKAKILLCSWCKTVGDVVIYLTYVQYKCKTQKRKEVDTDFLCTHVFPTGILSEQAKREAWDEQKIERGNDGSDNLLDYPNAYFSILFK